MRIQCLFGTPEVYMGGVTYVFSDANDRICDVREQAHIERFLANPKSYQEVPVITLGQYDGLADQLVAPPERRPRGRPRTRT